MIHAEPTVVSKIVSEKAARIVSQEAVDLVIAHDGLIVSIANDIAKNYSVSVREDLISCGRIALLKAAPKYQDNGNKFSTFAAVVVINARNSALTTQFNQLGGLKNRKVRKNYFAGNQLKVVSLDECVSDNCATTYAEVISLTEAAAPCDLAHDLEIIESFHQSWRTVLTEDQYRIIVLHFYDDCNFTRIGKEIGMKTSTVHYNYKCAIIKLKEWLKQ